MQVFVGVEQGVMRERSASTISFFIGLGGVIPQVGIFSL